MSVVYNGLNFDAFEGQRREPERPTIGYLARMIYGKGLTTLVDAFIQLVKRDRVPEVRLRIGGAVTSSDDAYIGGLKQKLADAGVSERVSWEPNLSFEGKVNSCTRSACSPCRLLVAKPSDCMSSKAQASGVPVVQPRHGAFPELLEITQGGVLCEPDDPASLASSLEEVLLHRELRRSSVRPAGKWRSMPLSPTNGCGFRGIAGELGSKSTGS